jgi:hypothetical protein
MAPYGPPGQPWPPGPAVHYVRPSVRVLGVDYGRKELQDVLLSIGALIAIFACGLAGGITSPGFVGLLPFLLPISVVACAPTFFLGLHLQKRIGAKTGCTVEFRVEPQWLGISVFFSVLLGFVFAVPGTTQRFGNLTRQTAGRMGLTFPGVFLAAAAAAMGAAYFAAPSIGSGAVVWLVVLVQITSLLALFQMIPIAGFPGMDLWRWSKAAFIATLSGAVVLFALSRAPELVFP